MVLGVRQTNRTYRESTCWRAFSGRGDPGRPESGFEASLIPEGVWIVNAAFVLMTTALLAGGGAGGSCCSSGSGSGCAVSSCDSCCSRPSLLDRLRECFRKNDCCDTCAPTCAPACHDDCGCREGLLQRLFGRFHRKNDCCDSCNSCGSAVAAPAGKAEQIPAPKEQPKPLPPGDQTQLDAPPVAVPAAETKVPF